MVRLTFSEGLVLMAVCLCFILPFSAGFSWKSCNANPDDDVIQVKELKVSPDILSLDGSVTLSLQVDVKRDLNGTLQAKTEIQKSSGVLQGQSIPCQGKFGSCTFLDACSEFVKLCPIAKGTHTVAGYTFKLPYMSAIVRWLAEGDYTGKVTISDGDGSQLACITLAMQVVS